MSEAPPKPFHRTPDPATPYTRRLLVISGNFPPSRAVGGLRWQKMSHFAAERGWGTDVVCIDPSSLAEQDPERLADLPAGIRLFGVPLPGPPGARLVETLVEWKRRLVHRRASPSAATSSPGAAAAASTGAGSVARAEAMAFRPWRARDLVRAVHSAQYIEGELRWTRAAVALARRFVEPSHQVIVTSGPPHFAHVAGRRLADVTGLPHVMDLRDPWSVTERVPGGLASPVYFRRVEHFERQVVERAALVVSNTELAARAMRAAYPQQADRVVAVMNGSDDETRPAVERDPRFLIAYTGAIYFDRDPRLLFRAAARVIRELELTPDLFGMELMGSVEPMSVPVAELARQEGVEPFVRYHPPASRSASARLLASASLLVSLPQDTETAIPSKIFEYSTYDAWLLALSKAGTASALVLEGSAADVVDPSDVDGIAEVLRRHYREFAAGVRPRAVGADGRFSRARQAALMLDHLERITTKR